MKVSSTVLGGERDCKVPDPPDSGYFKSLNLMEVIGGENKIIMLLGCESIEGSQAGPLFCFTVHQGFAM